MTRATFAAVLAALVGAALPALPATAAYPAGTVVLTPAGASGQAYDMTPVGASSAGVLALKSSRFDPTVTPVFRAASSGTKTQLPDSWAGAVLRGSRIYLESTFQFRSTNTLSTVGTCSADGNVADFTPNGAILYTITSTGIVLTKATVTGTSCTTSAFGAVGSSTDDLFNAAATGPAGIVIGYISGGALHMVYLPFSPSGSPVTLMSGQYPAALSVGSSAVSWYDSEANVVRRQPLTGAAGTSTAAPGEVLATVTTDTETTWREKDPSSSASRLRSWDGVTGHVPVSTAFSTTSLGLAYDGTDYFVGRHAAPGSAGVLRMASITGAPTLIWVAATAPLSAGNVVLSPGRATYTTDKGVYDTWSLYRRPLTGPAASLAVGAETRIAAHVPNAGLSVSGRRTAFETGGATADTHKLYVVRDGASPFRLSSDGSAMELSGLRVLYYGGGWKLRDLRPGGATTTLPSMVGPASVQDYKLWGDYLVTVLSNGQIRRTRLSSGVTRIVRAATVAGSGQTIQDQNVAAYGDVVAWFESAPSGSGGVTRLRWLNMATGTYRSVVVQGGGQSILGDVLQASAHYLVWDSFDATTVVHRVAITSTTPTTVVSSAHQLVPFSVDDDRLALIGSDGLARVEPLPAFSYRPRYLGLTSVDTTFKLGTANPTWDLETAFSKSLSSCTVTIKRAGVVVRYLSCKTASGAVVASWNGRNSSGALLPAGAYTWKVTGGDADGPLAAPNGTTSTYGGSFTRAA